MPDYKIGLDFGTTNSIISYFDNNALNVFKYGFPGHQEEYIPSFLAYDEDFVEIGTSARDTASQNPEIESYGNFKMRLPLKESDFSNYFQNDKTPMEVTADYLQELLLNQEDLSFTKEKGDIVGLVVSVPEIWQRDIYNLGRERLQKLIQELGLPLIQLVSEPVAAACYYTYEVQKQAQADNQEPFIGNLLVCDMGGGTFDVSLCHILGDKKVEVLYFDGQGNKGLECAGVAFDRRCVQIAYEKKHGTAMEENSAEFIRLLREFEGQKIINHRKANKKWTNYFNAPDIYGEKSLYTFGGGYNVSFQEVIDAFEPIKEGINKVINTIKDWLKDNNQTFDRLFFVGGFSQFYLVQKAITTALAIEDNDERFDRNFNATNSAYAISYGACLIANGLIDPLEKYVHTLGIVFNQVIEKDDTIMLKEAEMVLIEGGTPLDQINQPIFYERTFAAYTDRFKVPIWINPQSKNKILRKETPETIILPNYSQDAKYYVGMRVDSSQIAYLIIKEANSNQMVEYELGDILSQIFSGFYLIEE